MSSLQVHVLDAALMPSLKGVLASRSMCVGNWDETSTAKV